MPDSSRQALQGSGGISKNIALLDAKSGPRSISWILQSGPRLRTVRGYRLETYTSAASTVHTQTPSTWSKPEYYFHEVLTIMTAGWRCSALRKDGVAEVAAGSASPAVGVGGPPVRFGTYHLPSSARSGLFALLLMSSITWEPAKSPWLVEDDASLSEELQNVCREY